MHLCGRDAAAKRLSRECVLAFEPARRPEEFRRRRFFIEGTPCGIRDAWRESFRVPRDIF